MPRVREVKRCRASVVVERTPNGNATVVRPCLAPATTDGHPDCEHGREARAWVEKYAATTSKTPER